MTNCPGFKSGHATTSFGPSSELAVSMVSLPPRGIASRALTARFISTCRSLAQIAADIGPGLAKAAVAGRIDGREVDLCLTIDTNARVRLPVKLHRRVVVVVTEDAMLAEELLARKKLAQEVAGRLGDRTLLIRPGRVEAVVEELKRMGQTPRVSA